MVSTWSSPSSCTASVRPSPLLGSSLTMEDLRFYHQFLTNGLPTLPLNGHSLWLHCASMSYKYEHLGHAILGLGASSISRNCVDADYNNQALTHRVTAIKLVNHQLSNPPSALVDIDALLATIIILITQTSLMPEGMADYVTMIRGLSLVYSLMPPHGEKSIFSLLDPTYHLNTLAGMVEEQPKDLDLIDGFLGSIEALEPLCPTRIETQFHQLLVKSGEALRTSATQGGPILHCRDAELPTPFSAKVSSR